MELKTALLPPKAKKIAKELEIHGDKRIDNYYWLNQRESPEVLQYLEEENKYYEAMTQSTKKLQHQLFEEIKSKIVLDDSSVPYQMSGYWYYVRYEKESGYPIYCRKKGDLNAAEEVLFDVNAMAADYDFFDLAGLSVSPNNNLVAFGVDTAGRRQYKLQIKNLTTGEIYTDCIEHTSGDYTWAADNKTIFYIKNDEVTLRSDKVYRHELHHTQEQDALVFHEEDETFSVGIYKSKSREYILIASSSTLSDEFRFLKADNPQGEFQIFQERTKDLEYEIEHFEDHFYVLTNHHKATNFKLMKSGLEHTSIENWEDVIPHRKDVLLEDVDIFQNYLVLTERTTGLNKIRVMSWSGEQDYYIPLESYTYTASTAHNIEFETDVLRYIFNGLKTPTQVIDYNMKTGKKTVLKQYKVQDPQFNPDNYFSKRVWAKAEDGKRIPISLVYKKGIKMDGSNPLLLYAYGSYGVTVDPSFSVSRLSLLDRGFVFAIAHIRGGEYLGRSWYENGKLAHKINSFTDFIACSKYLIQQKYTSPQHLYAMGGSAGGLLMGGILNMAPQLYNGVVAQVPFVDVLTTMLDENIPLTTGEYDEWGNPNEEKFYQFMKAYSPYDNVKKQAYPHILVTTGFYDSQVQYWEPAKWVAKLRDYKTDQNLLLFNINMDAGHGGASGRFEALKELVEEYAFLLNVEGIKE